VKKIGKLLLGICKIVTTYTVIFFISFLCLSFQVRHSNELKQTELDAYATQLDADHVYQVKTECDDCHFEVIVDDIGDINVRLKDIMHFSLTHGYKDTYYLIMDENHSLFVVVNDSYELYYEYK